MNSTEAPVPVWLASHAGAPLGQLVDHTLLRPESTPDDILRLADEAITLGLGAVCVNGQWVGLAASRVAGSGVRVVGVAGFPLGASGLVLKAAETRLAVADGAHEVDLVLALGWLKAGRWDQVAEEISAAVGGAKGRLVKVIVESAALTPKELEQACLTAVDAGAGFVKTSTGFHPAGGATAEAVTRMRQAVGQAIGVKASGGIRTVEQAVTMLRAGADRLGSSAAAGWGDAVGPAAPALRDLLARTA
jgi:deoxyribose-phosphate aldolase